MFVNYWLARFPNFCRCPISSTKKHANGFGTTKLMVVMAVSISRFVKSEEGNFNATASHCHFSRWRGNRQFRRRLYNFRRGLYCFIDWRQQCITKHTTVPLKLFVNIVSAGLALTKKETWAKSFYCSNQSSLIIYSENTLHSVKTRGGDG